MKLCHPWVLYISEANKHVFFWMNNSPPEWIMHLWKTKKPPYISAVVTQHQTVSDRWQRNTAPGVVVSPLRPHLSYIVVRRLRVSSEALGCTCPGSSTLTPWNSSCTAWKRCLTERGLSLASQRLGRSRTCWIWELSIKSTVESKWRVESDFPLGTKSFK